MNKGWVYDPHSGGNKIPANVRDQICNEIERYASKQSWNLEAQLKVKFSGCFCYLATISSDSEGPMPLCRLRYFSKDRWSLALFMYSSEKYEPSCLYSGKMVGCLKESLESCKDFVVI